MKLFISSFILSLLIQQNLFAEANTEFFDLKKSIQYAIEHSPTFDSLKLELSIAKKQKDVAFAKMLPSLDLSLSQ